MDVASPHTRKLLRDYRQQSQDRSQLMYLQRFRATAATLLRIEAGALTLRAAFSHVPFWQSAVEAVQAIVLAPPHPAASRMSSPGCSSPERLGGGGGTGSRRASMAHAAAAAVASSQQPPLPPQQPFRPSSLQIVAAVQQASAVLCNDKPETFGAPDVLQFSVAGVRLAYDHATLLPDRPANKAGRLGLKTYATFLNSSTSRWEALYDSWPVQAEFVDIVSPIYLSDRQT